MKIWVGGLSPTGNLGAPALGMTLYHELKEKLNEKIHMTMVLPLETPDLRYQKKYAELYDIHVETLANIAECFLYNFSFSDVKNNFLKMQKKKKEIDIFIQIAGISYFDLDRNWKWSLYDFSNFLFCKMFGIKYIRFVQSYGPAQKKLTKTLSLIELKSLNTIYCRGKASKRYVHSIIGKHKNKIMSFPDIAIKLPFYISQKTRKQLEANNLYPQKYIVVTPSEVLYHLKKGIYTSSGYIKLIINIIEYLCSFNSQILLLPHKYSENLGMDSDYGICKIIKKHFDNQDNRSVHFLEEQIDVYETKGIISESLLNITSRYHGLVAGVSTCVPSIALGWNPKYEDLLEYYEQKDYYVDIVEENRIEKKVFELIERSLKNSRDMEWLKKQTKINDVNKRNIDKAFRYLINDMGKSGLQFTCDKSI